MSIRKPGKCFCMSVLIVFAVFIFRGTILAKRPPNRINLKISMTAKVKWKKQGDKVIPFELTIGNKAYKFVKQGGKWGINAPLKELIQQSPECKEAVHLAIGEIALTRIRDLVGGDEAKAEKLVNEYKNLKKAPLVEEQPALHGPSAESAESSPMPALVHSTARWRKSNPGWSLS